MKRYQTIRTTVFTLKILEIVDKNYKKNNYFNLRLGMDLKHMYKAIQVIYYLQNPLHSLVKIVLYRIHQLIFQILRPTF